MLKADSIRRGLRMVRTWFFVMETSTYHSVNIKIKNVNAIVAFGNGIWYYMHVPFGG